MLDVIKPGENGVLVPPGDAVVLAEIVGDLLTDEARRAQLGEQARQTVITGYTLQQELDANLALYAEMTAG